MNDIMEITNNTLVDAVKELQSKGYSEELRLHKTHLHAMVQDLKLGAHDFRIDAAYRFEGSTTIEDRSELYAISSEKYKLKGLLIDALDQFRKLPDNLVIDMLTNADLKTYTYDDTVTEIKYGMKKVYKAKYNESPERYELRKGFPDFPSCPYGNSFQMLGYDKELNEYVWLVTSIIKDDRLNVIEYAA